MTQIENMPAAWQGLDLEFRQLSAEDKEILFLSDKNTADRAKHHFFYGARSGMASLKLPGDDHFINALSLGMV